MEPLRWTPNQVVAYNLRKARVARGLKQEEAAERLRPLGLDWSVAVFSAAERSVDGKRIRQFTADELVAFASAFGFPVSWFLVPPIEDVPKVAGLPPLEVLRRGRGVFVAPTPDAQIDFPPAEMIRLLFANGAAELEDRISAILESLENYEIRSLLAPYSGPIRAVLEAAIERELSPLGDWIANLDGLLGRLREVEQGLARRDLLGDSEENQKP